MTPSPALSVLIATHNRREMLTRCLAALAAQTQDPGEFEVLVVDDGSTDGTVAALAELSTPFELRVIEHAKAGKPVVLNAAIEAARGEVCLFIDDDVIASPQLVAEHLVAHRREPCTLGIGLLVQREPQSDDWYVRAFTKAWNGHFDDLRRRPARWIDCYGANFSAPRRTLREIGGFAPGVPTGEDFDIAYRLEGAGLAVFFLADAAAVHDDEKTRGRMLADTRREGAAHVDFAARHPAAASVLLDWAAGAGPVELRLRRWSIALRVPPGPVVALGALVPGEGRKMVWMHFVRRLVLWRAIRRAMSRERWREVTRGASR